MIARLTITALLLAASIAPAADVVLGRIDQLTWTGSAPNYVAAWGSVSNPPSWVPSDWDQTEIWYDAYTSSNMTLVGSSVVSWWDRITGMTNYVNQSSALAPSWSSSAPDVINGHPSTKLNGTSQYWESTKRAFRDQAAGMISAVIRTRNGSSTQIIYSERTGSVSGDALNLLLVGGQYRFSDGNAVTAGSATTNAAHSVIATFGAAGTKLYVDGIAVGSNALAHTSTTYNYCKIGRNNAVTGSFFDGYIAETVGATGEVTEAEVETLADYYRNRWGTL